VEATQLGSSLTASNSENLGGMEKVENFNKDYFELNLLIKCAFSASANLRRRGGREKQFLSFHYSCSTI
jgi:hypothetical protein